MWWRVRSLSTVRILSSLLHMIFLYTCALVGKKMLKRETSSPVWSGNGYFILRFSALPKPFFYFQCLFMHVCVWCACFACMWVNVHVDTQGWWENHHPLASTLFIEAGFLNQAQSSPTVCSVNCLPLHPGMGGSCVLLGFLRIWTLVLVLG